MWSSYTGVTGTATKVVSCVVLPTTTPLSGSTRSTGTSTNFPVWGSSAWIAVSPAASTAGETGSTICTGWANVCPTGPKVTGTRSEGATLLRVAAGGTGAFCTAATETATGSVRAPGGTTSAVPF